MLGDWTFDLQRGKRSIAGSSAERLSAILEISRGPEVRSLRLSSN